MALDKSFVVRQGLEVATDLFYTNLTTRRVGIGSTFPSTTLDVNGGIGATDLKVAGFATIMHDMQVGASGSVFYVSDSSNNVGIGTSIPVYALDVVTPVSTGQTGLHVKGDVLVSGIINAESISVSGVTSFTHVTIDSKLVVAGTGATTTTLNVTGVSTFADDVSFGSTATFGDNDKLKFGDGEDLEIYHDGSHSYIDDSGTGNLFLRSGTLSVQNLAGSKTSAVFQSGSSQELYHNNSKKFETTGYGVTVTGIVSATSYYGDGSTLSGLVTSITAGDFISVDSSTGNVTITGLANTANVSADTLVVTGVSTLGVVTGATYYGDGSNLTGLVTSITAGDFISVDSSTGNVTITGLANTANVSADTLVVTGVSTLGIVTGVTSIEATTYYGNGSNLTGLTHTQVSGAMGDLVDDTTPQLGGNLDVNNKDITGTGNVNLSGIITATTFSGAFTGTATDASKISVADESTDTTCFPLFAKSATGIVSAFSGSNLTFNSSDGTLSASSFSGDGSNVSNVDADTVDTLHASSFLRSDTASTASGNISFTSTTTPITTNAVKFNNTENDGNYYTDATGVLAFDENFYSDTNYGTGTYDPATVFTGADGGGILIKNQDGWGAVFTSQNTRYATAEWDGLTVDGNRVLTVADEGSGNSMDADSVDGIHASSFLRSDVDTTKTSGELLLNDSVPIRFGTGADAQMFHNGSDMVFDFEVDGDVWNFRDSDDNTIFTFTENGNFGIGTSNPGAKLTIATAAGTPCDFRINEGTTSNPLTISQTATEARIQTNATQPFVIAGQDGSGTSSRIVFETRGNERMTVAPNGNLGIGTDNPQYKLQVEGDIKLGETRTLWFSDLSGSIEKIVGSGSAIDIYSDATVNFYESDANSLKLTIDTNNARVYFSNDSDTYWYRPAANTHAWTTAGTDRFKIFSDGPVLFTPDALGTTAGNTRDLATFQLSNGNTSYLKIYEERDTTGTDWTTAYTRIQKTIDVTDQAYIQFNGTDLNYGMEFGTTGDEKFAVFKQNNSVDLYYDNAKKFETTSTGVNVTGNVAVTGTVDGRDVATDGTKLDGIESGATGDQSASEILTAIKTVDGAGSGLDADTLDGQHGSYYLNTSTSFGGDVSGTYNNIVVANDSHNHAFNNLTGKTSGTGEYSTNGNIVSGRGSGGVALTINDGYGNANVTFNHKNGTPEQNGKAGRIEVNTDATSGNASMSFELGSATANTAAGITQLFVLSDGGSSFASNAGLTFNNRPAFNGGTSGSSSPFTVDSTQVVTNLNADLLDGENLVDNAATANTVAGRDGSGDIFARLIRQTYTNQSTISGGLVFRVNNSTDNYLRVCNSPSAIRTFLGVSATGADSTYLPLTGGTLSGAVTFNGNVNIRNALDLADNDILRFGTGDDAEFFCNGAHFYLDLNSGIGNFYIRDGTTTRFTFDDNGSFTATGDITAFSDITLKEDIEVIPNALDKVSKIRGVTFTRKDLDDKSRKSGVIAQEVEKVLPEVVTTTEDGTKTVAYGNLVGLLIESIKELKEEVAVLKEKCK